MKAGDYRAQGMELKIKVITKTSGSGAANITIIIDPDQSLKMKVLQYLYFGMPTDLLVGHSTDHLANPLLKTVPRIEFPYVVFSFGV